MEKTIDNEELQILKIIEKRPTIHHRKLLAVIADKGILSKGPATKRIERMITEKKIMAFNYGKEKQYVLADGQLSEKDLYRKTTKLIHILKKELEILDKEFPKYDYITKRNLPDYLATLTSSFLQNKSDVQKFAREAKLTDMSDAEELFSEICEFTKDLPYDDPKQDKHKLAAKTMTAISKKQLEYANIADSFRKMGASKKRELTSKKLKQLNSEIVDSYFLLERIRDNLKSMNGN